MLIKKFQMTCLVTTNVYNIKISEVENKIPDSNNLMITTVLNTKIGEVEEKIPDHAKYVTTSEFHESTAENFAARLKQANLMNKSDFDNKLINFNRKITSSNTKYLEVQKKLNSLTIKDYNVFLNKTYFTSDRSQNTFVYQPKLDTLELKKDMFACMYVCMYGCMYVCM